MYYTMKCFDIFCAMYYHRFTIFFFMTYYLPYYAVPILSVVLVPLIKHQQRVLYYTITFFMAYYAMHLFVHTILNIFSHIFIAY